MVLCTIVYLEETMLLKLYSFHRWAKREKLTDQVLKKIAEEVASGLIDADLGGGLFKKRFAKAGQGKRGGYRSLLAFKQNGRAVFLLGFSKNDRDNIEETQLKELKKLSKIFLMMSEKKIKTLIKDKKLIEVK